MRQKDVRIGESYAVKVSGRIVPVTLLSTSPYGGWEGRNETTGRGVHVRTAARLRFPVEQRYVDAVDRQGWFRKVER